MSILVMSKVWKDAPYAHGDLLVLLALADWADDQGVCWTKISFLAKKARLSDRAVQDSMQQLLDDGALELARESEGTKPRVYRISTKYTDSQQSTGRGAESAPLEAVGPQNLHPFLEKSAPLIRKATVIKATANKATVREFANLESEPVCGKCGGRGTWPLKGHPGKASLCHCPAGLALQAVS